MCGLALACAGTLPACTFSDALAPDAVRSVWTGPAAQASVNFVTDRAPEPGGSYGLYWDAAAHRGTAQVSVSRDEAGAGAARPLACGRDGELDGFAAAVAAAAREKHCNAVLLVVHGYNTTFRTGLLRAGQVAADTQWGCAAALFSWSSEGKFDRYAADIERSGYAVPLLMDMLRALSAAGLEVNVFAQSMGGRVTLGAIGALCAERRVKIGELVLAAPDVSAEHDNDDFGHLLQRVAACVNRTTVYASDNDMALIAAESFHGGVPRAGRMPRRDMQYAGGGYGNVDVVDTSRAPGDPFGHGYYVLSYEVLHDTRQVLAGLTMAQRAMAGTAGGATLACVTDCADGRYGLAVDRSRRPDGGARLLRRVWPLILRVQ